MKLEYLSDNIIIFLQEIIRQENLCKLLYYNDNNPLDANFNSLSFPANNLLNTHIFPYPFDANTILNDCSQLRVWYPSGRIKGADISLNDMYIDIVVAKNLFLINIDGVPKIRPYEIMKELIKTFDNKSISTLGKLHFINFAHLYVNKSFDIIQLKAEMMLI